MRFQYFRQRIYGALGAQGADPPGRSAKLEGSTDVDVIRLTSEVSEYAALREAEGRLWKEEQENFTGVTRSRSRTPRETRPRLAFRLTRIASGGWSGISPASATDRRLRFCEGRAAGDRSRPARGACPGAEPHRRGAHSLVGGNMSEWLPGATYLDNTSYMHGPEENVALVRKMRSSHMLGACSLPGSLCV